MTGDEVCKCSHTVDDHAALGTCELCDCRCFDEAETEPATYDLVMPFVVCTSAGGPYDDNAFSAGFMAGRQDTLLARFASFAPEVHITVTATVATDLMPQLDLIVMRHGFTMERQETEFPEWGNVTFRRVDPDA